MYEYIICNILKEWEYKSTNAYNEEVAIQQFINKKIMDRFILKAIKKGALLEKIPIDVDGRQYLVDIADLDINIRDDENKYFWYMFCSEYRGYHFYRKYALYRNYSQQYRDFGLILNALDQYLDNKTNPEWNTVEKIKEAIQFVRDFKKKCINYQIFNGKFFKFIFVGDDISNNKKEFISVFYDDFLKYMNLYKNILLSNNISHKFFNFQGFKDVSNFLSNFELNKALLSFELNKCLSTGSRCLEYVELYKNSGANNNKHHEYIMNVLKQVNVDLYKKLYEEEIAKQAEMQSKFKNVSLQQYDYKLHDLFYNFSFLKFLLPEEVNVNGSRILVQISLNWRDLYFSISEFFDIYFIPHDKNYLLYMSLSDFFNNEYDKAKLSEIYTPFNKNDKNFLNGLLQDKENLIKSIEKHKKLIIKHILKETKKHVKKVKENDIQLDTEEGERLVIRRIWKENEINKVKVMQTNDSLYDLFLIDYMDQYFSN